MNLLFLREYPLIDGTFTLLMRLASQARAQGHEVHLLFRERGVEPRLLALVEKAADVHYWDELEQLGAEGRLPDVDVIHGVVSGDTLIDSYDVLKRIYFPKAAVVLGVYHPRAFFTETRIGPTPDTRLFGRFFREVPKENLLFMNESVRRSHEAHFGISFTGSALIPLPIDLPDPVEPPQPAERRRIVSVGRLVEFKNYHRAVAKAVAELNRRGNSPPLEYHIYGDGPLRPSLTAFLATLPSGTAEYHGTLPYDRLGNVFSEAFLTVGMGTTIIEASALGVPSLLAVDSREDATYGWFYDQSGYEVGEQIPGKTEYAFLDLIEDAALADEARYAEMCRRSRERAQAFSIETVFPAYLDFLRHADRRYSLRIPKWQRLILKLARQPYKLSFLARPGYVHR